MRRHLQQHLDAAKKGLDVYRNVNATRVGSQHDAQNRRILLLEATCLVHREINLAFYEVENGPEREEVLGLFDEVSREFAKK